MPLSFKIQDVGEIRGRIQAKDDPNPQICALGRRREKEVGDVWAVYHKGIHIRGDCGHRGH